MTIENEALFQRMIRTSKAVHDGLLRVVAQLANEVASDAKEILTINRHVVTGNLRRSIKGSAKYISDDIIEGEVGTNVVYAPYIEALPDGGYLYWALNYNRVHIPKVFAEEAAKILREAAGR